MGGSGGSPQGDHMQLMSLLTHLEASRFSSLARLVGTNVIGPRKCKISSLLKTLSVGSSSDGWVRWFPSGKPALKEADWSLNTRQLNLKCMARWMSDKRGYERGEMGLQPLRDRTSGGCKVWSHFEIFIFLLLTRWNAKLQQGAQPPSWVMNCGCLPLGGH